VDCRSSLSYKGIRIDFASRKVEKRRKDPRLSTVFAFVSEIHNHQWFISSIALSFLHPNRYHTAKDQPKKSQWRSSKTQITRVSSKMNAPSERAHVDADPRVHEAAQNALGEII
jgi:hypothetical protein